ncbi:MAG: hypothetical protein HY875_12925 [Chloroflexi bacterium]|nr:hypothetical protein [Chloroflexota bacterium]
MKEADEAERADWEGEGQLRRGSRGGGSAVQSVRFGLEELREIRAAAARAGITTSEFIRQAAIARAAGPAPGAFKVTGGVVGEVFKQASEGTENPHRVDLRSTG